MTPYTMADAEAEMRAAIDSGERERIDAAAALVDRIDPARPVATLPASALWYAEQGLKVFPLSPGSKIPFKGSSGCKDASSDPDVINGWWDDNPHANIGIATGHLVDVVDIDGFEGQISRLQHWFEDDEEENPGIFAKIDADNVGKVFTPRKGGMHIYVPATGMGNTTNIVPSVDVRGVGGYVVAPPSVTDVGCYRWLGVPNFAALSIEGAA